MGARRTSAMGLELSWATGFGTLMVMAESTTTGPLPRTVAAAVAISFKLCPVALSRTACGSATQWATRGTATMAAFKVASTAANGWEHITGVPPRPPRGVQVPVRQLRGHQSLQADYQVLRLAGTFATQPIMRVTLNSVCAMNWILLRTIAADVSRASGVSQVAPSWDTRASHRLRLRHPFHQEHRPHPLRPRLQVLRHTQRNHHRYQHSTGNPLLIGRGTRTWNASSIPTATFHRTAPSTMLWEELFPFVAPALSDPVGVRLDV